MLPAIRKRLDERKKSKEKKVGRLYNTSVITFTTESSVVEVLLYVHRNRRLISN